MFLAALTLTLTVAAAPPADDEGAKDRARRAESAYAAGVALYQAKQYDAATERFEEAYTLYPSPNLAYNIGKSKEAAGDIDGALAAYQLCINAENAPEETRARARERVGILEHAKAASAKVKRSAPPPPPTLQAEPKTENKVVEVRTEAPPPKGLSFGAVKWVIGGAGALTAGAGAVFYALGNSDHAKVDDAKVAAGTGVASLSYPEAQALVDRGADRKNVGAGMIAGGGALVAIFAVMYLLEGPDDDRLSVQASAGPEGVGAVIQGAF